MQQHLTVREIAQKDIEPLADYWTKCDPAYYVSMGVDLSKLPLRDKLIEGLKEQLDQPYNEKKSYAIIWQVDGIAVGHSNINKIIFGEEAYMHLHLWNSSYRKKGNGTELVKMTLPYFFNNCKLKKLYCEPYALNPAPNNTLKKVGFQFVKQYRSVPNFLSFEQDVMRWEMSSERFLEMNASP